MATSRDSSFENDRMAAAAAFAQTMIVVDDHAGLASSSESEKPSKPLRKPSRKKIGKTTNAVGKTVDRETPLDAKPLIDRALELGLVCSVVRPERDEDIVSKVVMAAKRADIVSLDWQMNGDDGDLAVDIIKKIIRSDTKTGGRTRLIAIYTGVRNRKNVLSKIYDSLPKTTKSSQGIKKEEGTIVSERGLRIVYLFKEGIKLQPDLSKVQVPEHKLADRLLQEFSKLSNGLLGNVALATIAAVRDSTHHVLAQFRSELDIPYFHHRTFIRDASEAGDYAVLVVLSELKNAVDRTSVARRHAGPKSIQNRLQVMLDGKAELEFLNLSNGNKTGHKLPLDTVGKAIVNGWLKGTEKTTVNKPGREAAKRNFSTLLTNSVEESIRLGMSFASLTGVSSHPKSHLHDRVPKLEMGAIVYRKSTGYLLCLQAACDAVGNNEDFFFVPMKLDEKEPDHIIPDPDTSAPETYIGLSVIKSAYSKAQSIKFRATNKEIGIVEGCKTRGRKGFQFLDVNKNAFRWIATIKQRRALRSLQSVSISMNRLGFDEFEPSRKSAG